MISLAALRLFGAVIAISVVLGVIYYAFDLARDAGRNEVWGKVNETIDDTNDQTKVANEADAEKRALHERLRTSALLAAAKTKSTQCLLTAEEALAIGAIR